MSVTKKRKVHSLEFKAKLANQHFCAALLKHRLARCLPVLREALTGRYNKYGHGFHSIVRDLFESA